MKKYLLFVAGLSLSLFSYSQVSQKHSKHARVKSVEINNGDIIEKTEKGGGDVFWSTTFDWEDPANTSGWSLPDGWSIVDETDYGTPWVWRNDTIGGEWTDQPAPEEFDTPEDGFIAFPADEYFNRDDVQHEGESYHSHITTPSIDCSDYSSVVVSLNHLFRLCCNEAFVLHMQVTNDDGVHWANYDLRHGIGANNVTPVRFRKENINISDVAAGLPNVKIRFLFFGPSTYYWMIDDLKLSEAYQNELVLEDHWTNFYVSEDEDEGHINYWPLSQFGSEVEGGGNVGAYSYQIAMLNNGMLDQYNAQLQITVEKNGEQVYQEFSDVTTIWPLDRDTVSITENKFLADGYGDYLFNYEAISENEDEVPDNNSTSLSFTLNDTLMHRADFSAEGSANSGGWVGGENSGDLIGNAYQLFAPAEINSITAYLMEDANMEDDYNYESTSFMFHLMKYFDDEDDYISILTSEMAVMDTTMLDNWVTLTMEKDGESEFLEPGFYVAAVEMLGELGNGLAVGWDKDTKHPDYATYLFVFDDDPGWFNHGKLALIGINFNEDGGPTESSVSFNVDMNSHIANGEFNPSSDFVDVAGTFNDWNGSDALSDDNGDGIYSITVEAFNVASAIEYKYRINGSWETAEFTEGEPGRTYTIRYWNDLYDVYNNGSTTGVDQIALIENVKVYPNPSNGDFTVKITNNKPGDLQIRLLDIQGHSVFQKLVKGVSHHTETISNNFAKGVYFLSVNNGDEVKVLKVILK